MCVPSSVGGKDLPDRYEVQQVHLHTAFYFVFIPSPEMVKEWGFSRVQDACLLANYCQVSMGRSLFLVLACSIS